MTYSDDTPDNITFSAFYAASRAKRQALHIERTLVCASSAAVRFDSNDYFALTHDPRVIEAGNTAAREHSAGAGASRLAGGNHTYIHDAEQFFSACYDYPSCLIFGSGYAANTGAISALCDTHDVIIADKYSHACMIDGARLSGATLLRFRHNDVHHAETLLKKHRGSYRKCMIMTETLFSMDGDAAPIDDLSMLATQYDALLYADHAHGPGFITPDTGRIDILSGTFSKAYGSYGGYICLSEEARHYLINSARPFMFSTALPPFCVASAVEAARILKAEPQRAGHVITIRNLLLSLLASESGYTPPVQPAGAIVPYIIGDNEAVTALSAELAEQGYAVSAIRPPTVPPGSARLRIAVNAGHTEDDLRRLSQHIKKYRHIP